MVKVMKNGFRYVLTSKQSNMISMKLLVLAGSKYDVNSGTAHLCEHLLFAGNNKDRMIEIENKGGILNAITSKEFTSIDLSITKEYFQESLKFFSEILLSFKVDDRELKEEKLVVMREIFQNSSKLNDWYSILLNEGCTGGTYSRASIGSAEGIMAITKEEVMDYYMRYFITNKMIFIVTGDIDEKDCSLNVEHAFKEIRSLELANNYEEKNEIVLKDKEIRLPIKSKNTHYVVAFLIKNTSYQDRAQLELLRIILFSSMYSVSKMFQKIRVEKKYQYSWKDTLQLGTNSGFIAMMGKASKEKIENIKSEINDVIDMFIENGVEEKDFEIGKRILMTRILNNTDSNNGLNNFIGTYVVTTNEIKESVNIVENYLNILKRITIEEFSKSVNEYLKTGRVWILYE